MYEESYRSNLRKVLFGIPRIESEIIDEKNEFKSINPYRDFKRQVYRIANGYWLNGEEHQIDGRIYYDINERRFFQFLENKQVNNLIEPDKYKITFSYDEEIFTIYDCEKAQLVKPHEVLPNNRLVIRVVMIIEFPFIKEMRYISESKDTKLVLVNEFHGILRTKDEYLQDLREIKGKKEGGN